MAAQKNRPGSHVPRFGNWDANDHAPYTKVFETARAGRGGKLINPNDPTENPEAFAPVPNPVANAPKGHPESSGDPPRRPRPDQHRSREEGEFKRYMESPARIRQSAAAVGRTASATENNRRYNGVEGHRSPLHPQAKMPEKAAPALPKFGDWDAKDPSSGEGFTTIFNNARTEKQTGGGAGQVNSGTPDYHQVHGGGYGRGGNHPGRKQQSSWFCCFS